MSRSVPIPRRALFRCLGRTAAAAGLGPLLTALAHGRGCSVDPGALADEIETVLWENYLPAWFPRCLDEERGGFHEVFAEDWTPGAVDAKFLVHQARQTWTAAAVAMAYPEHRDRFLRYAHHGLAFLRSGMWDEENGGFFDWVDPRGGRHPQRLPWKNLYAQSFGIYAAARAAMATGSRRTLELGERAFRWLDRHGHDDEYGGYFEHFTESGRPILDEEEVARTEGRFQAIGVVGQKSMNAHIHLLEALSELFHVWPEALLRKRLEEVFALVRDRIVLPAGHLAMFTDRGFTPRDERGSYGHQLEIAYLLVEAEEALGRAHGPATRDAARRTVDHAIRFGWDTEHGGFFDEGPPEGEATRRQKIWWVLAEALNGLIVADHLFGTDEPKYRNLFVPTWAFYRDHLLDHRHGGSFAETDEAGRPLGRSKANPWKTTYHEVRAFLFAIQELRKR